MHSEKVDYTATRLAVRALDKYRRSWASMASNAGVVAWTIFGSQGAGLRCNMACLSEQEAVRTWAKFVKRKQGHSEMPNFSLLLTDDAMVTKLQEQARIAADRKLQRTTLAGAVLIQHVNKSSFDPTY